MCILYGIIFVLHICIEFDIFIEIKMKRNTIAKIIEIRYIKA